MCVLVTGGAGFIGSALCRQLVRDQGVAVVNVDKLTYAGNLRSLDPIAGDPRYVFERVDICDRGAVAPTSRCRRVALTFVNVPRGERDP